MQFQAATLRKQKMILLDEERARKQPLNDVEMARKFKADNILSKAQRSMDE